MQAEGQNTDYRGDRLWSLRPTRLDHRIHNLLREAEETEETCQGNGVQEPQGHHRLRTHSECHDIHYPTRPCPSRPTNILRETCPGFGRTRTSDGFTRFRNTPPGPRSIRTGDRPLSGRNLEDYFYHDLDANDNYYGSKYRGT